MQQQYPAKQYGQRRHEEDHPKPELEPTTSWKVSARVMSHTKKIATASAMACRVTVSVRVLSSDWRMPGLVKASFQPSRLKTARAPTVCCLVEAVDEYQD